MSLTQKFVLHDKLTEIVKVKRQEIAELYEQYPGGTIPGVEPAKISLEAKIEAKGYPFFITEFKRQSPSEGSINPLENPFGQVAKYLENGCGAISVLADSQFFGGSFDDISLVSAEADKYGVPVLHKDFILDPVQIYRGRKAGASAFLMIPRILEIEEINTLFQCAQDLKMGILYEIHDMHDFAKIEHLNPKVIGVNNRDLSTFKVAQNRSNVMAQNLPKDAFLVAESGIASPIDMAISASAAGGFLVGTALMRGKLPFEFNKNVADGKYFFKACGLRRKSDFESAQADLVGVNFSPISKRKIDFSLLDQIELPENAVAVFRENSGDQIKEILSRYPFKYVQLYADEVGLDFIKSLSQKVILGVPMKNEEVFQKALTIAQEIDFFILDGAVPGSGDTIKMTIPADFPYPFMLAGGLHPENIKNCTSHRQCIGVDIASGIETNNQIDPKKVQEIKETLSGFIRPPKQEK